MSTEKIMEQAQVFASAWSVVGGPFDGGDAMEVATQEKDELKRMVVEMVDERSALAQRTEDAEQLATARGHTIQGLRHELLEVKVERDALAARLAELEGQEPVAAQCRFKDGIEEWMWCDLAHHRYVQATLSEWAGYETRALFARPVPAEQHVNARLLEAAKAVLRNKRGEDDWLILSLDCLELEAAIAAADATQINPPGEGRLR